MKLKDYIIKNSERRNRNLKYDFMPALLEVIERPSHMAGKVIIIAISLLLLTTIIWSNFAKIDVVVSGNGYITTAHKDSVVTSSIAGVVNNVCVKEGDLVEKGQALVKLDSTQQKNYIEQLNANIELFKVQKEVAEIFLADINAQVNVEEYSEKHHYAIKNLIYSNELVKTQVQNYPNSADSIKLDYEAGLNKTLCELTEKLTAYENELETIELELDKYIIKAPISGYILITQAVCEGQNVLPNQQLMTITPCDSEYIFKGYLSDKDIAGIESGANVALKLTAYSYSDYGSILGEIVYISPTIVEVNNNQVAYEIWVDIDESGCNNAIKLMSGMTGNVEVKVGKRSVMDYFLEPILGSVDRSLKEK